MTNAAQGTAETARIGDLERRHNDLRLRLLRIYEAYALAVAVLLLTVFYQTVTLTRIGSLHPTLFQWLTVLWGTLSVTLLLGLPRLSPWLARHRRIVLPTRVLIDLIVVITLIYASGGIGSGLGTLLLPTLAMATILLDDASARAAPAAATLLLFLEEFYLSLYNPLIKSDFFQAGVLGAACFGLSLAAGLLSRRIRENDLRAIRQAAEVADLEQLNLQILGRMRTGIMVVTGEGRVRVMNDAAGELLGRGRLQSTRTARDEGLPPAIARTLTDWRALGTHRPPPLRVTEAGPAIRLTLAPVHRGSNDGDVILFLEDAAELEQRAQQLKLAALGQLSASIAHEIRNPLSAISHAAQLLAESPDLTPADGRLAEIISSHCGRMNQLVQNVLHSSRSTPPLPELIELQSELTRRINAFRETTPEAIVDFAVSPANLVVRMDRGHLDQVLSNLLGNAIRHSQQRSGRRWARVEAGIEGVSGRPILSVLDEGSGVDAALEARLFEPFFTTEPQGTGLGLYLSRALCQANQADLRYHPRATGGACFRITFAPAERSID
ncbi:MAG: sensor histidine kinase [Pseudomonadales bacterium]